MVVLAVGALALTVMAGHQAATWSTSGRTSRLRGQWFSTIFPASKHVEAGATGASWAMFGFWAISVATCLFSWSNPEGEWLGRPVDVAAAVFLAGSVTFYSIAGITLLWMKPLFLVPPPYRGGLGLLEATAPSTADGAG